MKGELIATDGSECVPQVDSQFELGVANRLDILIKIPAERNLSNSCARRGIRYANRASPGDLRSSNPGLKRESRSTNGSNFLPARASS